MTPRAVCSFSQPRGVLNNPLIVPACHSNYEKEASLSKSPTKAAQVAFEKVNRSEVAIACLACHHEDVALANILPRDAGQYCILALLSFGDIPGSTIFDDNILRIFLGIAPWGRAER